MGDNSSNTDDLLLKQFFTEVSEVERDNEVNRFVFSPLLLIFMCLYFSIFCKISICRCVDACRVQSL